MNTDLLQVRPSFFMDVGATDLWQIELLIGLDGLESFVLMLLPLLRLFVHL